MRNTEAYLFDLDEYLSVRRQGWQYGDSYSLERFRENGFAARIKDELAGVVWAEDLEEEKTARMKMDLKSRYAEFGIGTELLTTLMRHLQDKGYTRILYTISPEYYAYQIYHNLGFHILTRSQEEILFEWKA